MPLLKLCSRTGCSQIVPMGVPYCDIHQQEYEERKMKRYKEYDSKRKQNEEELKYVKFYHSKEWEKCREYVKQKQNGLDLYSYFVLKKVEYAYVYHHIVELRDDFKRALDVNNIIGLSGSNHRLIHEIYKTHKKEEVQRLLFELVEKYYLLNNN